MLTFKGAITYDLVNALLNSLEPKLQSMETHVPTRKKLYNILVECLQNTVHHSDQVTEADEKGSGQVALLLVTSDHEGYQVQTGNTILNHKIQGLKEWLESINRLSPKELKECYKTILDTGSISDKGTAGLGFVDIARKSGQKLNYDFQRLNNDYSIFSFTIHVNKAVHVK